MELRPWGRASRQLPNSREARGQEQPAHQTAFAHSACGMALRKGEAPRCPLPLTSGSASHLTMAGAGQGSWGGIGSGWASLGDMGRLAPEGPGGGTEGGYGRAHKTNAQLLGSMGCRDGQGAPYIPQHRSCLGQSTRPELAALSASVPVALAPLLLARLLGAILMPGLATSTLAL